MSYQNQKFAILDGDHVKLVTIEQWAEWMGKHRKERVIGHDELDGYVVSTIFLGLDYEWHLGRPLYWETRIFDPPNGRKHGSGRPRELGDPMNFHVYYPTALEARAGHAIAMEWLKEQLKK